MAKPEAKASVRRLRVGLIGASEGPGWAVRAHVPALLALEEAELCAVATTRQESADATARRYGVARAYGSADRLIADPEVEVVAVAVKVPGHYELVKRALAAGKHVYCEWPLGRGLREAEELRDLASGSGRYAMVGLQARRSPALRYARDLVARGFVGRVLSCDLSDSSPDHGRAMVGSGRAWMVDRAMGANVFTIKGGHSLDALAFGLDTTAESVGAILATRTTRATVSDTGEERVVTSPDQVVVAALLRGGALAAIHLQGGAPKSAGFRFEIHGDRGTLRLAGTESVQTSDLALSGADGEGAIAPLVVPASYLDDLAGKVPANVANVARAYRALFAGIRRSEPIHPDFEDAVSLHRLLETIERASDAGRRQSFA